MKKINHILIIILILSNIGIGYGQVCGQFFDKVSTVPVPLVKVSFKLDSTNFERSDVNGEFVLEIPSTMSKSDLYFETLLGLIVRIKNVPVIPNEQLNLGKIFLPDFKYISIEDYKKLNREQQKECIEDRHYADVHGYSYTNQLDTNYLILKCIQSQKRITDFSFDPTTKIITLDWNMFNDCE